MKIKNVLDEIENIESAIHRCPILFMVLVFIVFPILISLFVLVSDITKRVLDRVFPDIEITHKCTNEQNDSITIRPLEEGYNPFENTEFSEEKLIQSIHYFKLESPEWVLAQAKLETGFYKSNVFREKNNLFGLYDSRNKAYFSFKHWSNSVIAYKSMIQSSRRFNPSKWRSYGDYLNHIGYAEDSTYIDKLKALL